METENRERHEDVASLGYRDRNMNDKALLWNATLSRSLGRTNQFTLKLDAHDILRRTSSVRYTLNAMGQKLHGMDDGQRGLVLPVAHGWHFSWGSTGICSLGNSLYYVSHNGKKDGLQNTTVHLYRWAGDAEKPFQQVAP